MKGTAPLGLVLPGARIDYWKVRRLSYSKRTSIPTEAAQRGQTFVLWSPMQRLLHAREKCSPVCRSRKDHSRGEDDAGRNAGDPRDACAWSRSGDGRGSSGHESVERSASVAGVVPRAAGTRGDQARREEEGRGPRGGHARARRGRPKKNASSPASSGGIGIDERAMKHERTRGSIEARLMRLGKLAAADARSFALVKSRRSSAVAANAKRPAAEQWRPHVTGQ